VRGVLVDTGPLVALVDAGDPRHHDCDEVVRALRDPLITVWPVLTEALYLLGSSWRAQESLLSQIEIGALHLAAFEVADVARVRELMEKYRDLPMDFADAALVRVAERDDITRIFTLDRRHFSIYRSGRRRFSIVPLR
jgi:predicted nucleic acid-binding protein